MLNILKTSVSCLVRGSVKTFKRRCQECKICCKTAVCFNTTKQLKSMRRQEQMTINLIHKYVFIGPFYYFYSTGYQNYVCIKYVYPLNYK